MASVVRNSFLIISMILCSCSSLKPLLKDFYWKILEEPFTGKNISITCATEKMPQDGVSMWKMQNAQKPPQKIFYFSKGGTLNLANKSVNVHVNGKFPNLTATIVTQSITGIELYWCEFNYYEEITPGPVTVLRMKEKEECPEGPECLKGPECPEKTVLYVIISLLFIIGFICLILRIKRYCEVDKPSNISQDSSVYEEMNRNRLNTASTLINQTYQSSQIGALN